VDIESDRDWNRNKESTQRCLKPVVQPRGDNVEMLICVVELVFLPKEPGTMLKAMQPIVKEVKDENGQDHLRQLCGITLA
jgi:hypothetical protein